jgi:hypothetical protein
MRADEHFQGQSKSANEPSGHLELNALKSSLFFSVRCITILSVSRQLVFRRAPVELYFIITQQQKQNVEKGLNMAPDLGIKLSNIKSKKNCEKKRKTTYPFNTANVWHIIVF